MKGYLVQTRTVYSTTQLLRLFQCEGRRDVYVGVIFCKNWISFKFDLIFFFCCLTPVYLYWFVKAFFVFVFQLVYLLLVCTVRQRSLMAYFYMLIPS